METKLLRIANAARNKPTGKFSSLVHLINKEMLTLCHHEMKPKKASGVDEVTKLDYERNLEKNLEDLLTRMKRQAYKPQDVKRVYIPKGETKQMRPLGLPAYEDKLVQSALSKIISSIYEEDFLDCSFGFRPKRSCHDALKLVNRIVNRSDIKYVVDVDIKGFFDHVSHDWLRKFLKHRISDPNIDRLIYRFLRAGILDKGKRQTPTEGTPQGGVISPLLANIYLHYVVDIWFEKKMRKVYKGRTYMVRYADDMVFCFENHTEAVEFYGELEERLKAFNLELSKEKSKIIKIKDDDENNKGIGSFDFLGFTHYLKRKEDGKELICRKTSKKSYFKGIKNCKQWMKQNRTLPTKDFMRIIKSKVQGHINYFGVTDNRNSINNFVDRIRNLIFKWLNRRSQRKSFRWDQFVLFMKKYPLPKPRIKVNLYTFGVGTSYAS